MNSQREFVSGLPGPDRTQRKTLQQALDDLGRAIQERKLRDRHAPLSNYPSSEVNEKEEAERKALLEELDAEEWYAEKARREKAQAAFAAAWARRDHLLSDDDLPF